MTNDSSDLSVKVKWKSMEGVSTKWITLCLLQLAGSVRSIEMDFHPCDRNCVAGAPARWCQYDFHVQWYESMSKACYNCPRNITDCSRPECIPLDGVERPIVTVNKIFPGPMVQACVGDMVEIIVHNHLPEETTSIHWHGLHQRESPYMDGVPFVTQCPIQPRSRFKYVFLASTPGTHFWHSHSGSQRGDGMFGGLIIRRPRSEDPHRRLYDHDLPEHVMTVMDWHHQMGTATFLEHHHSNGTNKPNNILVNGKGRYKSGNAHEALKTPLAIFNVKKGEKYRFRLINAGFLNCPIEMSIDNHTITVINSDGGDIEPEEATSLVSYAGERWDFTVHPSGEVKNYWIRYRGLMDCDQRFTSAYQVAILHYEGAPDPTVEEPEGQVVYSNSFNPGMKINPLNEGSEDNGTLNIAELRSMEPLSEKDPSLKDTADFTHYLAYDFYRIDNPHYHKKNLYGFNSVIEKKRVLTPQINHISMKLPSFPLLPQRDEIKADTFCEPHKIRNCSSEYCECTHHIKVPFSSVVELVLVDEGFAYDANHPFHLHGHPFRVVAMERVGKNVTVPQIQALDRAGLVKRNLKTAPLKDTVTVPDGGYTIIRFHATNPGYWLFHCHIEFHVEMGMAVVFKIGEDADMPPVPHGFPKCGDFLPPFNEEMAMYDIYNLSQIAKRPSTLPEQLPSESTARENPTSQPSTAATTTQSSNSQLLKKGTSSNVLSSTITEEYNVDLSPETTTTVNLPLDQNKQNRYISRNRNEDNRADAEDVKINDISSILQLLQGNIIKTEYRYNQHEAAPEVEGTTMYNLLDGSDTNQLSFTSKSPKENVVPPRKTSLDELHFAFIPIRIRNPISNAISGRKNVSDTENEISRTLLTAGKNYLKSDQIRSASSTIKSHVHLTVISFILMKATMSIHLWNIF
uniref:Laccase 1 n=1 Tax=Bemisia tabaci TaxID=7038 RepID=A0A1U9X1R6_BEMTA|nr:laccase 1 [Bemisia tabaci]